ncbi:hypothetical protein [Oceanibium sediminis]|uniref:hypothetical protein n=1 Tax=Oceanibium sediminis TaxID=2026339 RepID=UPI001300A4D8|nr:hypothetical protein [Oceanibium sediminis]
MTELDDPRIAASGILNALLDIDGHVTRERQSAVLDTLSRTFLIDDEEARELAIMGAWIAAQADSPEEAVFTLSRRLRNMRAPEAQAVSGTMRAMIDVVMSDANGRLSRPVQNALTAATTGHA